MHSRYINTAYLVFGYALVRLGGLSAVPNRSTPGRTQVTLPGVDIAAVIQAQRRGSLRTLQDLTKTKNATGEPESAEDLAWQLVIDSQIFAADAEVRWLDHSEARLTRASAGRLAAPMLLNMEPPKRGRPAKATADADVQVSTTR